MKIDLKERKKNFHLPNDLMSLYLLIFLLVQAHVLQRLKMQHYPRYIALLKSGYSNEKSEEKRQASESQEKPAEKVLCFVTRKGLCIVDQY